MRGLLRDSPEEILGICDPMEIHGIFEVRGLRRSNPFDDKLELVSKKPDLVIVFGALLVSMIILVLSGRDVARAQAACDIDCLSEKVTVLTRRVAALERLSGVGGKTAKTSAGSKENFMNLPSGSAMGTDWTKIEGTDFWFDQSLYGNVAYVIYSGWVENGTGFVRLFDKTNGRAVDGSEVAVAANTRASFYSGNLAIWRGQNQYYLQVKNLQGNTVTVTGMRLKIVTQ